MAWGPGGVTFTDSKTLTDDEAACVTEASQTVTEAGGTIRVKLADKMQALQLLGKHLGMFVERHEHTGANGEPIQHEHSVTGRIDQYTAAFAGVADRAGEGGPAGDGAGEPVRP